MPPSVNKSNAKHYKKSPALTEYFEFEGRDHWTCAAPGWEAVADHALDWALRQSEAGSRTAARVLTGYVGRASRSTWCTVTAAAPPASSARRRPA